MRILHAITTLDMGGAEMHLLSQVRGQTARGHAVRVGYLKGNASLRDDFLAAGAEWVGPLSARRPLALAKTLRWAEIVHTHLLKADALVGTLATLCGRRRGLISGKHNDEKALRHPLVSNVHRVVGNLSRRTIPLSDHVARYTQEHGHVRLAKQRRVYYGIDPEPFRAAAGRTPEQRAALRAELGAAPDDVVFICVARFAEQKAHDVLLRAFRKACDDCERPLRLWLVGDDPFGDGRQRAEAWARDLALGERVNFTGIRRDVPELLAASDVFVMSSLWEGLGLVFLEAMATGRPVLATRVSAVPEVVVPEPNGADAGAAPTGVLVAPSDDTELAAAMVRLALDPDLRERLGANGARRVEEHFGLDRMVDETLDVYAELLSGGAPEQQSK